MENLTPILSDYYQLKQKQIADLREEYAAKEAAFLRHIASGDEELKMVILELKLATSALRNMEDDAAKSALSLISHVYGGDRR